MGSLTEGTLKFIGVSGIEVVNILLTLHTLGLLLWKNDVLLSEM
jgi:hypothetical protein